MAQITRLGLGGFPRPPYGSFAGKAGTVEEVVSDAPEFPRYGLYGPDGIPKRYRIYKGWEWARIQDEERRKRAQKPLTAPSAADTDAAVVSPPSLLPATREAVRAAMLGLDIRSEAVAAAEQQRIADVKNRKTRQQNANAVAATIAIAIALEEIAA